MKRINIIARVMGALSSTLLLGYYSPAVFGVSDPNALQQALAIPKTRTKLIVEKPVARDQLVTTRATTETNENIFKVLFPEEDNIPPTAALDPPKNTIKEKPLENSERSTTDTPLPAIFEKRNTPLSVAEQAILEYQRALELISGGDILQAESILENILAKVPAYKEVRLELANLYLKFDRDSEAETLIKKGLLLTEDHPEFLKLLAIISERKGTPEVALAFLDKLPDNLKEDMNTAAFVGQLYQQTGRFKLAQQHYTKLLQREPTNPRWLLGATIAWDSAGKKKEALAGYKRLLKEATLETSLSKYIETRIAKLKG
jgi:tetratricopeptide (TPR) repeat protein